MNIAPRQRIMESSTYACMILAPFPRPIFWSATSRTIVEECIESGLVSDAELISACPARWTVVVPLSEGGNVPLGGWE